LEKRRDEPTRTESKTQLVEQINICLRSGDYARALELLRGAAAEFPNDGELSELEKLAQDGVRRNAEANRLITESQDLFAQRKSAEAIQLLRDAYALDKTNSLARAILANALVEHAHSVVETDWWEAETLAKQALDLNPAHPTAKSIRSLIIDRKKTSSVEEWVSQARKLQSSGDLFTALARVAEGMDVHPNDPKLIQIQDEIQRDQASRRRQSRRRDLEDLRRLEGEIEGAADAASKQALAERIQAMAAKYWTDGEILSVANGLLNRLGLVPQESSSASPRGKGATVIFHVPRPSAPKPSRADTSQIPPSPVPATNIGPGNVPPTNLLPGNALPTGLPASMAAPSRVPESVPPLDKVPITPAEPHVPPPAAVPPVAELSAPAAKVTSPWPSASSSTHLKQPTRSKSAMRIVVSAAAIMAAAAIFFLAGKHHVPPVVKAPEGGPIAPAAPAVSSPSVSTPAGSTPPVSAPAVSAPAQTTSEALPTALRPSPVTGSGTVTLDDHPQAESGRNAGTLIVVAGQDDAKVFLDGKLQGQLTQAGQLRLTNLKLKDYLVQISKSGFHDPPPQKVHLRKGEDTRLIFDLQPEPRLASLTVQGGASGTEVLVDQTLAGTIQPDGTLSVSTINPGDHTVELRKQRFKTRQFREHFVAGGTVSIAAADAALEAAPGELKITFAPADAKVALVKGELLTTVSSGVPLNLAPGTYTLTARTADRFTRWSTVEVIAGESKTLDLSLAPSGMAKWDDPAAWKQDRDSFVRKGGDFVLYGAVPASGTFVFSAMLIKGHLLQWVLNYTDPKNYVLFQMDDNYFYRAVIHNGEKTDEIKVSEKGDKKTVCTVRVRVSPTEIVHQIKHGDSWPVVDRWTQSGANLSLGKFGFYIPSDEEVALSGFAHYADLNIH